MTKLTKIYQALRRPFFVKDPIRINFKMYIASQKVISFLSTKYSIHAKGDLLCQIKRVTDPRSISSHRAGFLNGHWKVVSMMYVTCFREDSCNDPSRLNQRHAFMIEYIKTQQK